MSTAAARRSTSENIGPYFGRWRRARKPHRCGLWRGACPRPGGIICAGEMYYDTCVGAAIVGSWFQMEKLCGDCAEASRRP